MHPTTIDFARNEVRATVTGFSYFAIGGVIDGEQVWVDFGSNLFELGTRDYPLDTLVEAVAFVNEGGTIFIRGDTGTPSTSETITIIRELRIEAVGGAVRIGDSP